MKKQSLGKRVLSGLLAFVLVLSLIPAVFADGEGTETYTKITSMEQLTTGKYVMVVDSGYAPLKLDGSWIMAAQPTVDGDTVTDAQNAVWTLTVDGTDVKITDSNGVSIAPKGGNNNGIQSGEYNWTAACENGVFTFSGQGEDTVILASNTGSENKFRAYKAATVSKNPGGYPSAFTLYKLAEAPSEPERQSGIVTDLSELKDGDTIVIFNPAHKKALSSDYAGSFYNQGVDVTVTDGVLSGYTDAEIWTLGINEDGTYTLATADGMKLGMADSYSSMTLGAVNEDWEITAAATADCVYIKNVVRGNYMEWFADKGNWSSYYNIGSNEALFAQQIYLIVDNGTTPNPDPEPEPEPEPEFVPISDALAGENGTTFTVKGVVTLVDGQNIYLQDTTGGICVRMSAKPSDIALGDTIIGTGSLTVYNGMPQLGSGTYEKSSGLTLTAKATTIGALTTADLGCYVKISNVEITEVYDNNGKFSSPNVTVTDGTNSIQIYKAVVSKTDGTNWDIKVGDKVDVLAAVSCYNSTLQLRNTLASEIIPARQSGIISYTELKDGDRIVIFNPEYNKALSSTYSGFYNAGVDVSLKDGVLTGFGKEEIWTVGINEDGTYTFTNFEGKKIGMDASYSSMPLDGLNQDWVISAAATADCVYIKNAVRGNYMEWYADKSNWSSYSKVNNEALFAQQIYLVAEDISSDEGVLVEGNQVVIYNISAEGVLSLQDENADSPSITEAAAQIKDNAAVCENGAVIFTIQKNGDYYRFYNETFGYLCSNGTGNNAFYSLTASEDADWTLAVLGDGYSMESRTAKYNGQYSQYLEYYASAFKTYSMYNVTDYDIYTFQFYPVANDADQIQGGIVNAPSAEFGTLVDAFIGQEYDFSFTFSAPFGIKEFTVSVSGTEIPVTEELGRYSGTVPAELVIGETITIVVSGKDNKDVVFVSEAVVTVKDEPVIDNVYPASGSETGDNKKPVISAEISNAGENATVEMLIDGEKVDAVYEDGKVTYTPVEDMPEGKVTVTVTITRADGKSVSKSWSFTVGKAQFRLYFGQLHSHTTYSDGSGSLESALDYVKNLPESANVDFVAFTDHSNYFDKSGAANPEGALYDMSLATEYSQEVWSTYKSTIINFNNNQSDVIAFPGFEMTWSGGPGHINTFNTEGIVSRNNTVLNNKTDYAGLKAYYALLSQAEGAGSISQLNHPGSTFGTFADFSYWDAVIDSRVFLVEVGNGEGQIGAGGYYPSYEYYTMALDKGWHVAPTNNQDNHKGKWGNANDARDVILTDNFTLEGMYEAIRNLRVYATEDKNLEIYYTVNGMVLGSSITEVPEKLTFNVQVYDPDAADSISKIELIVNSGKVAYTWNDPAELATGNVSVTLDPSYSYYYVRVTEGDGDLAVTAPVWVGESLKLGISSFVCGTSTPVTDEELTLTTTLFNSESSDATITSITYTTNGSEVIGVDTTGYTVPASGTLAVDFNWTPKTAKLTKVTATVVMILDGEEYTFSMDVELDVLDNTKLVYIGIDASHYNEYVNGNYKDSMGNFGTLAASYGVRTVTLNTSEDLIAACSNPKFKALIMTAPSRRSSEAQASVPLKIYTDEELAAITAFNANGGIVILAGWSDHYENYPSVDSIANMRDFEHMAATQNAVLKALGSSLRIGDDATYDDVHNGGQAYRLYFNTYGDSFLTDGVEVDPENPYDRLYTEVFSHYGGASVYVENSNVLPETVNAVVYGHADTYSVDVDNDGLGGSAMPKYEYAEGDSRLLIMATEQLDGKGLIVVSGAAFMSNFEVQATIEDSGSEKNYSNYRICENLLAYINPTQITSIADVQAEAEEGIKFTIECVVTSNASGYDKDSAFFDCIYVQDATGGINAFPVAGEYKIGDIVRITGTTSSYQGERQIAVISIEKIGETDPIEAKNVTAKQINDGSVLGQLVKLKGTVVSYEIVNGLVQTIIVKDAEGNTARVFIDGYITTGMDVQNLKVGYNIEVVGCASYDNSFDGEPARIRIRNRADIVCTKPDTNGSAETGDLNNVPVMIFFMVTSAACLAATVVVSKKRSF